MILSECAVFAAMLLSGSFAGAVCSFFFLLGKGSGAARATFDFLSPITVGVTLFFALRFFASGAVRVYSLIAFLLGIVGSALLLRRFSPRLKRLAKHVILPIKSLSESLERKLCRLVAPFKNRLLIHRETARKKRAEKRNAKELARSKKRTALREKKERDEEPRKKNATRKGLSALFAKRRKAPPFSQSD